MLKLDIFSNLMKPAHKAILDVMFNNREAFYLRELAKAAGLPVATTHRAVTELTKLNILTATKVKHVLLYTIQKNEKTQPLAQLFRKDIRILDEFTKQIIELPGLKAIVMHGKETEGRISLLLIGDKLDESILRKAVGDINDRHNILISYLPVTVEQYKQMGQMGMWNEQKKVIWEREES
jgi:DNA-binding transcriptional regulator YhcF (GntR family)